MHLQFITWTASRRMGAKVSRYMLWKLDAVLTKVSLLCQSIFHSSLKISLACIVACVVVHILEFEVGVLYVADVWLWFIGLKVLWASSTHVFTTNILAVAFVELNYEKVVISGKQIQYRVVLQICRG